MDTKNEPLQVEMHQHDNIVVEDNMNKDGENLEEICSGSITINTSATVAENDPQQSQHMATENIQPNSSATNSHNSEPRPSPLQRILPVFLFDVALTTLDVGGDLSLRTTWIIGHHYIYGGSLAIPLLLCFLSTAYKWYKLEEPQDKRWSWVFLLLQCWPQLRALRVIRKLYTGDPNADEEKTKFSTELGSIEPFLESYPSVITMSAIWAHAISSTDGHGNHCKEKFNNACAVFGGETYSFNYWWFYFSYCTSAFAASLGITKLLINGPCPVLI